MPQHDTSNPYAPPSTPTHYPTNHEGYRYDGEFLWVIDGASLPERCVVTNASLEENPELKQVTKKISWSSPWFALLILLHVLIFLLVALLTQKKAKISFYIDRKIIRKQRIKGILILLALLGSLTLIIGGGIALDSSYNATGLLVAIGVIGLLCSVIFAVRVGSGVRATKHDNGWFRLSGVKQPFLDSLTPPANP